MNLVISRVEMLFGELQCHTSRIVVAPWGPCAILAIHIAVQVEALYIGGLRD